MTHISFVEPDRASGYAKKVLDKILHESGRIPDSFKAMAHSPGLLGTVYSAFEALREHTQLDPRLRELAALHVAWRNHYTRCVAHHTALAQRVGLTGEQIGKIGQYEQSAAFSELEKLVLRYATDLTEKVETDSRVLVELRQHLSERELVELNLTVGLVNLMNRFNESFAIGEP